jgi:uridine kinase
MRMSRADQTSVLVFHGSFLHRPELWDIWDLTIFLEAPFDVTIPRGADRGPPQDHHMCRLLRTSVTSKVGLYLRQYEPQRLANVVIDYSDLQNPVIIARRWPKSQ